MQDCRHKDGGSTSLLCEIPTPEYALRQLRLDGVVVIDRWRGGDPRVPCTYCEICGNLFRTSEFQGHISQAHLGSRRAHEAHKDRGCRMLVLLAAGICSPELDEWVQVEVRLRDVRETIEQ